MVVREVQLPWYAVYVFRNEKGTGAETCPAINSGMVTEDALVSYWPMLFRKSSNKNDRDQVLRARETEHPTQTFAFAKTCKMPNLVEVIVI